MDRGQSNKEQCDCWMCQEAAKRTWEDWTAMVQKHFPSADHDTAWDLLWNATAFPAWGTHDEGFESTEGQIKEFAERSGQDPEYAMRLAADDLDRAMR